MGFVVPPLGGRARAVIFTLSLENHQDKVAVMNATSIKEVAERQPFRPFIVRLNNGIQYRCDEPRNFGAPENYRDIIYFGKSDWVIIGPDSIAEVILQ